MSRKLFNKAKEITQNLTHKVNKTAPILRNYYHKDNNAENQPAWTNLAQQLTKVSTRLQSLRLKLDPTQDSSLNFNNDPQQKANQPGKQAKEGKYSQSQQKSQQPLDQANEGKIRDKQIKTNKSDSWFLKSKLRALKSTVDANLAKLQEDVLQKKQNLDKLKAHAQQALSAKSQQLKGQVSDKLSSLKGKKEQFIENASNKIKSVRDKSTETAKEKVKVMKEDKLEYIKAKIRSLEQYLHVHKQQLQDMGHQSTEKLSENAQKLKNTVKDKISEAATTKAEIISKLISKLFWRIALLIGVASFAYGMGTSLPRELREHFKFLKKQDNGSKGQQGRNEKLLAGNSEESQ